MLCAKRAFAAYLPLTRSIYQLHGLRQADSVALKLVRTFVRLDSCSRCFRRPMCSLSGVYPIELIGKRE